MGRVARREVENTNSWMVKVAGKQGEQGLLHNSAPLIGRVVVNHGGYLSSRCRYCRRTGSADYRAAGIRINSATFCRRVLVHSSRHNYVL